MLPFFKHGCTQSKQKKKQSFTTAFYSCSSVETRPLFRLEKKFNPINSTTFVLFDKYCPIVDQLGSKDSSCDLQLNCVISYFFTYI
jgi:hypothetical protein